MGLEPITHTYTLSCRPEGGRVYATHRDVGDVEWGQVTVWDPPRRIVYASTLAQRASSPSEIDVRFTATESGCAVRFEHGGWTEANAAARSKFSEWRVILDRFAELTHE